MKNDQLKYDLLIVKFVLFIAVIWVFVLSLDYWTHKDDFHTEVCIESTRVQTLIQEYSRHHKADVSDWLCSSWENKTRICLKEFTMENCYYE